jgi:hypothetical protein
MPSTVPLAATVPTTDAVLSVTAEPSPFAPTPQASPAGEVPACILTVASTNDSAATGAGLPTVQPWRDPQMGQVTVPVPDDNLVLSTAISADAHTLIYAVRGSEATGSTLLRVPMAGGVPTELARANGPITGLALAPDDRSVLIECRGTLFRLGLDGGAPAILATGLGSVWIAGPNPAQLIDYYFVRKQAPFVRFHPAGDKLVYSTPAGLSLLPLDGGAPVRLTGPPPAEHCICAYEFSPDGRWLVYSVHYYDLWERSATPTNGSGETKISAVYSVAIAGGQPALLASAPTENGSIGFDYTISPDSRELLFSTDTGDMSDPGVLAFWRVPISGGMPPARRAPTRVSGPEPAPTPLSRESIAVMAFAWPTWPGETYQIQPERSALSPEKLTLYLANPADPQDYIVLTSYITTSYDIPWPCPGLQMVSTPTKVVNACPSDAGMTISWPGGWGWQYTLAASRLPVEPAADLVEAVTMVDYPTAEARLAALLPASPEYSSP